MTHEEIVNDKFDIDGYNCQYYIKYLNVQEQYLLFGVISHPVGDRRWLFDKQKSTPYLEDDIKNIFMREKNFMEGVARVVSDNCEL